MIKTKNYLLYSLLFSFTKTKRAVYFFNNNFIVKITTSGK